MDGGPKRHLLVNGRIFTGEEILSKREVLLADGQIQAVRLASRASEDAAVVDLDGGLLAPGFIDCQVNGGGGVLFNDQPSIDGLEAIIRAHRPFGTTGCLPTVISDDWDTMTAAANAVRQGHQRNVPGLLGVHFEGPCLNPDRSGAHPPRQIRGLDPQAMDLFKGGGLGSVVVTLAPECVPSGTIGSLADAGVRVCAGH